MKPAEEVDVDGIQQKLGCGLFQYLTFLVLGLIYSRGAWHVFGIMFLAGDPGHTCALPDHSEESASNNSFLSSHMHTSPWTEPETKHYADGIGAGSHLLNSTASVLVKAPEIDLGSNTLYVFQADNIIAPRGNWTADTCEVAYTTMNGSSVTVYSQCPYGWSYGSTYETTVLSEWDLVCDRNYMVELSITVFMFGATVGAMLILPLADRFGRKNVMLACLFTQAVIGSVTAFVNNYILFTILRFVVGMLNIGVGLSSFVLVTETFPAKQRTVVSIAFQMFWAIGVMTVAGFGHLVRNWRHLELLLSLPSLLALPCYWLLPESLPWLISRKQWGNAQNAIQKIARVNGKKDINTSSFLPLLYQSDNSSPASSLLMTHLQNNVSEIKHAGIEIGQDGENSEQCVDKSCVGAVITGAVRNRELNVSAANIGVINTHLKSVTGTVDGTGVCMQNGVNNEDAVNGAMVNGEATESVHSSQLEAILELFHNRQMRLYCCVMFFLFFVNSLGYFGISFSVPVLHGNPFVNLFIIGAVEIPADIVCFIVSQRIGRRYPNAVFLLLCGISNIVALFTPDNLVNLKLGFVMLGKFAITAAYSTVYLYSAEIFPTAVRNQAMGMSSVFENLGSISAPFIVHAAKSLPQLPLVVFGALSVVGSGLTLLLPETHNRPLPQTIQEITTWG